MFGDFGKSLDVINIAVIRWKHLALWKNGTSKYIGYQYTWRSRGWNKAGETPGRSSAAGTGTWVIKNRGSRGSLYRQLGFECKHFQLPVCLCSY